jgi:tetratricopeptide (TPR) repeat protein
VATALVAMAAAAWWQPHLHGQRWPFVVDPARPLEHGIPLKVEEWVPPSSAAQADAGAITSSLLLAHLRVDESGTGTRVKEEGAPLVLRRPLAPPPMPTMTPGQGSGPSRGVVILANGRDADLLSKCYALITVIREVFLDPIPIFVFHLGRAESFSPAAIGAFAALGNVTVADLGASTEMPSAESWAGGLGALSKPRAALAGLSRWQSVLLLDADAVLFQPPSAFFEAVSFRQTGLALWRDYHPCFTSLSPSLLQRMHINSTAFCAATRRQESDASAVVVGGLLGHTVEKSRCAAAAAVAVCEHDGENRGDSTSRGDLHAQKLMLGDKDSWAIGAALCGMGVESSVNAYPPGAFAVNQPSQQHRGGGSTTASERGVMVAIFNGHLQFDQEGQPLYWNGNGQSALELAKALVAASSAAQDGQRASIDTSGQTGLNKLSLQYLRNVPSVKLKPVHTSELKSDGSSKERNLERAEEITLTKIDRGKVLSAPPLVMQALTAAAEAISKLSTMDGINTGHGENNGDAFVAIADLFQVVTTMLQRGRRLQHAKRAASALLELDRAASLACAQTDAPMPMPRDTHTGGDSVGQAQLSPQTELLALCATATHALAGSLSAHGNSAAAARAYRKVLGLIEQFSDSNNSNVELPQAADVMLLLVECLAGRTSRGADDTTKDVSEALSLVQKVLEINPSSITGRLQHGTLLLREMATTSTSGSRSATQRRDSLASRQQAALDEFDVAIALAEADSAVPCAAAHVKRAHLLESWADAKVGSRTAEAHESYAAALELIPQDEDAEAGFKRTLVAVHHADTGAAVPAPLRGNGTTADSTSPGAPADDGTVPQSPLCTPGEEEIRSSATASNSSSGVICVACAAGKFDHDKNSLTTCVPCRPGYNSPPGSTICLALKSRCESGHMETLPGAALAAALAASGMQANSKGKGLFRNHQGLQLGMQAVDGQQQLECVACPEGTFDHDRSASTPCVKCRQGMYSPSRSVVCVGPSRVTSVIGNLAGANFPINASRFRKP